MMQETSRPMTGSGQQNLLLMVAVLSLAATAGLFFAYLDQSEFFYGRLSRGQIFGRDFASFWTASQLALADRITEIFDAEAFHLALAEITGRRAITLSPFPYPPHALVFFLPLALLPYVWAFATWMIGLWVLYALVAARGGANNAYRALALLIAPSTVLTVTMGQNGFLSAILFVGGMNLLWRAPIWAGVLFGLLTFKPQLGLLIPVALLAGCHWRAVASASATAVVLLGGSLIVLGAETWELYLSTTVPFQRFIMEQWTGALTQMVPSPFMAARLLDLGVPLGYAMQALSLLVAAAGVAWAFRGRVEQELQTATLLVATFLATPYIFNYDMTLLSVAIIYLVQHGLDRGFVPGERWLLGFAWLLPLLMMFLHAIFPVAPFVLAALFAVTLYHVQQARSGTPIPVRAAAA